eukprot:2430544-Rhodomonas_salina.3
MLMPGADRAHRCQPALRMSRGVDQGSVLVPFLPRGSASRSSGWDRVILTFDVPSTLLSGCASQPELVVFLH